MITLLGNRYQIVREIGAGAMGHVFQAVDTKTGKAVAAKVMIADQDESLEALLRFYQEGAVLSTLRHPNIVLVQGTFLEEGTCSIVMELLEGYSLADVLRRERLSLERVRSIASQTAAALAYAHSRGIIHRDVKPSNIMVVGEDHVKVTDFGIARVAEGGTLRTATGMSLGTPLYMSPEQIEGGSVDARSDVYSLGAVIFEMLAGRPPFEGRDPLSVAFKHVHTAPPRPSTLNADVPPDWEQLVLRMLEKDPARRIQTAQDVVGSLEVLPVRNDPTPSTLHGTGADTRIAPINPANAEPTRADLPMSPPELPSTEVAPIAPEPDRKAAAPASVLTGKTSRTGGRRPVLLAGGAILVCVVLVAGVLARSVLGGGAAQYRFVQQYGTFNDPEGVAIDAAGNLYTSAWGDNQIVVLGADGTRRAQWGAAGAGMGQLNGPTGVAIAANGNVLVADSKNNRIQEFSPSGKPIASWGGSTARSGPGQLRGVHGLAVDTKGNVYAADYGNNRVVKFSAGGTQLNSWGGPGTGPGQFAQPVDVALDRSGFIYVADANNHRVEKLTPTGVFVKQFTGLGQPSGLVRPHGVAVDVHGNIFVADYQNNVVEEVSSEGTPIQTIGGPGAGEGQFDHPTDLTLDAQGRLYVADSGNNRVQVFALEK